MAASPPKNPSPLRESTLWDANLPQRDAILSDSSKGWSPLRISKRSSPSLASLPRSSSSENDLATSPPGSPRRTSNSFKQLSRGLVSNSVFKQTEPTSPSSLRTSPVIPRSSRLAKTTDDHGLGIAAPNNNRKRAPRESESFTTLGDRSLVSSSVFSESPLSSSSALASPKRMVGPRTLQSPPPPADPIAQALEHSRTLSSDGSSGLPHRSSSTRSRSKTVTFSEEQEVREFERADYEARDSLGSEAGARVEEEGESDESNDSLNNINNVPSAQEMIDQLLREEELENEARLLSLKIQEADRARQSTPTYDDVDSPERQRFDSRSPSPSPDRSFTSGSKRPLPILPNTPLDQLIKEHEEDAELTVIEKSMDDSMLEGDMHQETSNVISEEDLSVDQSHGLPAMHQEQPAQPAPLPEIQQTSPLLYWDESALERVLNKPQEASPPLGYPTSPRKVLEAPTSAPTRANSFRNGRPKMTREGVQERLRLKQLGAAHEINPASVSQASNSAQPFDPIRNLLNSSTASFTDDQFQSPLDKLGAERYRSPSIASLQVEESEADVERARSIEARNHAGPAHRPSPAGHEPTALLSAPASPTDTPGSPVLEEREKALLDARRRSRSMREDGPPDLDTLNVPARPAQRRRSLSTGDATQRPSSAKRTLADPAQPRLTFSPTSPAPEFAALLAADLSSVANPKSYRAVERHFVADDSKAGPVGGSILRKPKAWKKIRKASDMYQRADEIRALREETTRTEAGIYLRLCALSFDPSFRAPQRRSVYWRVINRKAQNGESEEAESEDVLPLQPGATPLLDEWVLPADSKYIYIKLKVRQDPHMDQHLVRNASVSNASVADSQVSHKTSSSGLRKLFGSPKKPKPVYQAPVVVDPFTQYIGAQGFFAEGILRYSDLEERCYGKIVHHNLMLKSPANGQIVAKLSFKMCFLPSLPGSLVLPENIEEFEAGIHALKTDTNTLHKGELSQMGADCTSWRRRTFEIKGYQLLASNEVTKQVHAVIDLRLAKSIADLQSRVDSPSSSRQSLDDDESFEVKHSFKITFVDRSEILFYADNEQAKRKWLDVLQQVLVSNASRQQASKSKELIAPLWAVALQRQLEGGAKGTSAPQQATNPPLSSQQVIPRQAVAATQPNNPPPSGSSHTSNVPTRPSMPRISESSQSLSDDAKAPRPPPEDTKTPRVPSPTKPPLPNKDSSHALSRFAVTPNGRPASYSQPRSSPSRVAPLARHSVQFDVQPQTAPAPYKRQPITASKFQTREVDASAAEQAQRRRP